VTSQGPDRRRRTFGNGLPRIGGAVLLACLAVPPRPLSAQVNDPEVTSLRFVGNEAISDRELEQAIYTRESQCRSFVFYPLCLFGANFVQDPYLLSRRILTVDAGRIRILYARRGFRNATVDTTLAYPSAPDSSRVDLTFTITENDPVLIRSLEYTGLDDFEGPNVLEGLQARVGGRLDGVALAADRDSIVTRLWNLGYAHADVFREIFVPSDRPLEAQVTVDVYTGPRARIGPVDVVGNELLDRQVIDRMLPFREGNTYNKAQIIEAQRNLYNLELVRFAKIDEQLDGAPDTIPLTVTVAEGDLHRVRWAAGLSTADCLNGEARWTNRSFYGGARRVQVRGRLSNVLAHRFNRSSLCGQSGTGDFANLNWQLAVDFTQPWILGSRNALSTSFFYERQSLPDVFIRKAVGATMSLTRNLGRGGFLSLSVRPQVASLEAADIYFCASFVVCTPQDIRILEESNWLSPVALTFTKDRTNQLLDPTRGYRGVVEFEYAADWTGSDFGYDRWQGEISLYRTVGDVVVSTRLMGGRIAPRQFQGLESDETGLEIVHPERRFYSGGSTTVRGYAENQLGPRVLTVGVDEILGPEGEGPCAPEEVMDESCDLQAAGFDQDRFLPRPTGGNVMAVANTEVRFRLLSSLLQGAAFIDVGRVWEDADQFAFDELRVTPGFGVRYFSPIGPIRLDLGYRLGGGEQLRVVTTQIESSDLGDTGVGTLRVGQETFVRTDELAVLRPTYLYDDVDAWSLRRFQLHLSIGQAY
jgi:outer membrane protein insertion porin family